MTIKTILTHFRRYLTESAHCQEHRDAKEFKKRKITETPIESPQNSSTLIDRVKKLEEQVALVLNTWTNFNTPGQNDQARLVDKGHTVTSLDERDFNQETREPRNTFYTLYGELKTIKTDFSRGQLAYALTENDFNTFKTTRTELTTWLKTGQALSRQLLEDLNYSHMEPEPYTPLLMLRTMAVTHSEEFTVYEETRKAQRHVFIGKLILNANSQLISMNEKVAAVMSNLKETGTNIVLAKAFKAVSNASSYLLKPTNKTETRENYVDPTVLVTIQDDMFNTDYPYSQLPHSQQDLNRRHRIHATTVP